MLRQSTTDTFVPWQGGAAHPEAVQTSGTGPSDAQRFAEPFDPLHDPYLTDSSPFFAQTRAATPVYYSPDLDSWIVTRYHEIRHIFQTPQMFSAADPLAPLQPIDAAGHLLPEGGFRQVPTPTLNDPPGHPRGRRLVHSFTPRRIGALEPFVRELTGQFFEEQMSRGRADLVRDLAWDLPALVIDRLLDIPDKDVACVRAGAASRLLLLWGQPTEDEQVRLAERMAAFWRYVEALVVRRAERPRDDLTSDLLLMREGELPALTRQQVIPIVSGLLLADHETTIGLLGNVMRRLLTERHAWEEICDDPSLIPNAIEEVLRFDSSGIAWRRQTTQAVEIGGVRVPARANLLLLLHSANRDPAVFADPNHFDIHRRNAREHLSFGNGAHDCLGAPLARLEARVVLEELSARLPGLRLVSEERLRYQPSASFLGPLWLLVEWDT